MLRWVWDITQGLELPLFNSVDDVQTITGLILRHYYFVGYALNDQTFEPRIMNRGLARWCRGYYVGITVGLPDWEPLRSSRAELFETLLRYGTADVDQVFGEVAHEPAVTSVTQSVLQIHAACQDQRLKALSRRVSPDEMYGPKEVRVPNWVRRHDPCPCGSKKDFKLCHGGRLWGGAQP
jgi:uncharacterized protein YecA (UPF0149 family)